jgi:hypothetical protein
VDVSIEIDLADDNQTYELTELGRQTVNFAKRKREEAPTHRPNKRYVFAGGRPMLVSSDTEEGEVSDSSSSSSDSSSSDSSDPCGSTVVCRCKDCKKFVDAIKDSNPECTVLEDGILGCACDDCEAARGRWGLKRQK